MLAAFVTFFAAHAQLLVFDPGQSNFKLADKSLAPNIYVSSNDIVGVARAAQDLAWDFGRVLGVNGSLTISNSSSPSNTSDAPMIIAGTIGNSRLIDDLVSNGKLDVTEVEGRWEMYTSQVIQDPVVGIPWALVIAGSDRRGTIYGFYDISEKMGVSPWYWWADVPVKTKEAVYVSPSGKVQKSPSVKYRGFFINDESPALSTWVQNNFGGTFNSDFYRLVFELCLRLKGNYIWPAMWGKMFYVDDEKNGQLAHDFGIVMGTSHHEPMARSEKEQNTYLEGDWDWGANQENIETFFTEGIERAKDWETYWTMGMRGSGDAASPTLTAPALEEIIQAQQSLLTNTLNDSSYLDIPQTWVLYKEVSEYYASGMEVPDSITLLWTDDNSGNLIRVPIANETDRAAGAGVYYHFDYVGGPRSYKWINTIQLVKTWEQMHLAYERNARQIWLVNVGDIKPLEIPLTHFMDMAYDMDQYKTPDATAAWIRRWATREFNERIADRTVDILSRYGTLIARRKYELLSELPFAFSTINYGEAEQNLAWWQDLLNLAQSTYDSLDQATRTSFFQLVLHPVLAGKTVVDLYTKTAFNRLYAQQSRSSTNVAAQQVRDLFTQDSQITNRYHTMSSGKWNGFVNQVHIGYTSWNDPPSNANVMPPLNYTIEPPSSSSAIGIGIQGSTASFPLSQTLTLLSMDPYMPPMENRTIDIFARKNGTFTYKISTNASYVQLFSPSGTLKAPGNASDTRTTIAIDWASAPSGLSTALLTLTASDSTTATLRIPINKTTIPSSFAGFVESNGAIAIEAAHYTTAESKNGVEYVEIPSYGRTLSAIKPWPVTMDTQTPDAGPALIYSVYTTTASAAARLIVMLGAAHNHDPTRPLRFAYAVDGGAARSVDYVSAVPPYKEGQEWRRAVVANGWTSVVALEGEVGVGAHELRVWLLEPGVVLQRIILDMGGLRESALGPWESRKV
ncbi:hypothetical protein BS50DRAFT_650881 [Corynespora cassiicola Philippines]|uniref:Gylcosyl hydrolase 115 C-terminal domain-containing protein n=1 Tax=Corynespora cassiicola Philippines TaxID=1448308 RepID=A0A2T2NAR1_CORCC|nr:hypothetical protein BS50DRAFT_650881 [Corynespora cassiicola Philippines]